MKTNTNGSNIFLPHPSVLSFAPRFGNQSDTNTNANDTFHPKFFLFPNLPHIPTTSHTQCLLFLFQTKFS